MCAVSSTRGHSLVGFLFHTNLYHRRRETAERPRKLGKSLSRDVIGESATNVSAEKMDEAAQQETDVLYEQEESCS